MPAAAFVGFVATAISCGPAAGQRANEVESVMTDAGAISVQKVVGGLNHPWGMAFLPDGRILLTERAGQLRIFAEGELSDPVEGVPEVWANGQGGLLDVVLDPSFEENRYVYLSYAKPGPDGKAATALGRGKLTDDDKLDGFEDIFVQEPWVDGPNHFGSRIVFRTDGTLFLTLGERYQFDPAQDLENHLGTVIRLNPDGSVPKDNPFVDDEAAKPEIWSYGHRNIQAAAIDPLSGELWIAEMGPLGGDELNQPEAGKNYGWPVVSWGINYDGTDIPDPPTRPEFADAVRHWSPVVSPSGMVFYNGDTFEAWQGSFLIGGLSSQQVRRVVVKDGQVTKEEQIPLPARIREVEQGPDGRVYVLTDRADGELWRFEPME
ncbi:MAG: PQQ-dependent sugar dehydrogenase [Phycisphaerae bacterium]